MRPPEPTQVARGKIKGVPLPDPWKPIDYTIEEAAAVKAVMSGRASEDQQLRAMKFIVERLCGTYDLSFRSEKPYDTAFAEGKRMVGLQLIKFYSVNLDVLRGKRTEQGTTPKENP